MKAINPISVQRPKSGVHFRPKIVELQPAPDPFAAFERLAHLPHAIFFDSALSASEQGRYSYVAASPYAWLGADKSPKETLESLARTLSNCRLEPMEGLPPFQGGAAGLFSYELGRHFERLPRADHDEFNVPDLALGLYDWVVSFDHRAKRAWLVSTGWPEVEPGRRERRAERRARQVCTLLGTTPAKRRKKTAGAPLPLARLAPAYEGPAGVLSNFTPRQYQETVRRAIEYIHAGDCFQVNLAQRLLIPFASDPLELYRSLRQCNPAPFAAYFDLGDFVIASASPERFLRLDKGIVETRPIKGTRPRGQAPEKDQALRAELENSAKDHAENVMIVDLMRNDLGRVCSYGTVRVSSLCQVESFQTVHHLVSEINGVLRPELGPLDLLSAAFPGGSVTGAPKIRAMEIIAELEPTVRGAYCGSLGWIGFDGSMDTSILIRTFTIGRGWAQFPVGGGIVADSDPQNEYEETWHKAEGLLRALATKSSTPASA